MKAQANRTLADLRVGREPLIERIKARIARSVTRLTEGQKVFAVFCTAGILLYVGLGMIRYPFVVSDEPTLEYIPVIDWWMWLLTS